MRRLSQYGALTLVALASFACGGARKAADAESSTAIAAPPTAANAAANAANRPPGTLAVESEAIEPPAPSEAAQATSVTPGEPPEFTALKAKLLRGDNGARSIKPLQTLSYKHPKNAEIAFLLGQLYLEKLWVDDGLKAFRRAVEIDPSLRSNPFLIRAVIHGLGNDGDARQVRRFLAKEIGAPAAPYLTEVLYGDWRQQVKDRAKDVLADIP